MSKTIQTVERKMERIYAVLAQLGEQVIANQVANPAREDGF
jgi:hypothetical protein